jgi:hypothetical protein
MKDKLVGEIESLNIEELDVEALESRMELAAANLADMAWMCGTDTCDCNGLWCSADTCGCNVYCAIDCGCDGNTCDTLCTYDCTDCVDNPPPI